MTATFTAIDVETANADLASICQIGIVHFENGRVAESVVYLVNPDDFFDGMNVSIHGIDEDTVADAPTFPELADDLTRHLSGKIVVHHTHFDRSAIRLACENHKVELPDCTWLDSARVVRRVWLDIATRGYGLRDVADRLGIEFNHHDAEEDARAAGEILVEAIQESGMSLEEWTTQANRPIGDVTPDANPDGVLFGEVVVFTGSLTILRREAAALAAKAGCDVGKLVNKKTSLLIVGDQDVAKLAGHGKSSKHRKAESLIEKGQSIRILRESDFRAIVGE